MPRISKKNEEVVTYSVLERDFNSTDFLKDPALFKDPLPQPYRRIDRILEDLLNETWHVIEKNHNDRTIELSKPRPPKFVNKISIDGLSKINTISSSKDENNELLFIGMNGSLACVDVAATKLADKVDLTLQQPAENCNLTYINSMKLKQLVHFVLSISNNGSLFMHLFIVNKFYPIQSIVDADYTNKFTFLKCDISSKCDYIAFLIESKTNYAESFIDVYKCPRDVWIQTTDNIISTQKTNQESTENQSQTEQAIQIQKPAFFCKIKPPINQFKVQVPLNSPNVTQLLKSIEPNVELIGLGTTNCFSKGLVDLKNQLSERIFHTKLNDDALNQLTGQANFKESFDFTAKFKFLPANRFIMIPNGLPNDDLPNQLMVCWNNSHNIMFYPLGKLSKELESKVEYVMPFSSDIVEIQLTKCNNLIALILRNNNLIVFDLNTGVERRCAYFESAKLKQIAFSTASNDDKGTFSLRNASITKLSVEINLICLLEDGQFYSVDCSLNSKKKPQLLFTPKFANKDDKCVQFVLCNHVPNLLLLLTETNKVYLLAVDKAQLVCELENKEGLALIEANTNQVSSTFAGKDEFIFLKGFENGSEQIGQLVCHSLRLISILDDYFYSASNQPVYNNCLPRNATLGERMKILLKNRIEEQTNRKERLKLAWSSLNKTQKQISV